MKQAVLFLPGRYPERHLSFYRKLCRGSLKVAVDGGFRFFKRAGIIPDILIGDMDSIGRLRREVSSRTEIHEYPCGKDKSDTELAIEHCGALGCKAIDIVQPSAGDPDHFAANLMLLTIERELPGRRKPVLRIVSHTGMIGLLTGDSVQINHAIGDTLSVVPISKRIKLTVQGSEYDCDDLIVRQGRTVAIRNRITQNKCLVKISGSALIFRFRRRR